MHNETRRQSGAGASQQRDAHGAGNGQTRRQMRVDGGDFVEQPAGDGEQREDRQARNDQLELISSIAQPVHRLGLSPEMRFGFLVFHQDYCVRECIHASLLMGDELRSSACQADGTRNWPESSPSSGRR